MAATGARTSRSLTTARSFFETVYRPEATQPRAYLLAHGNVREENGVTIVEV
jgi:hypothetical protein